jgi:hypothetical protein
VTVFMQYFETKMKVTHLFEINVILINVLFIHIATTEGECFNNYDLVL